MNRLPLSLHCLQDSFLILIYNPFFYLCGWWISIECVLCSGEGDSYQLAGGFKSNRRRILEAQYLWLLKYSRLSTVDIKRPQFCSCGKLGNCIRCYKKQNLLQRTLEIITLTNRWIMMRGLWIPNLIWAQKKQTKLFKVA